MADTPDAIEVNLRFGNAACEFEDAGTRIFSSDRAREILDLF